MKTIRIYFLCRILTFSLLLSSLYSLLQNVALSVSKEVKKKWGGWGTLESKSLQPKLLSKEERKTEPCDGGKGLCYGINTEEWIHSLPSLITYNICFDRAASVPSFRRHSCYIRFQSREIERERGYGRDRGIRRELEHAVSCSSLNNFASLSLKQVSYRSQSN